MKIAFSKNQIKKNDISILNKILKSGWLTHGKYTKSFEDEFKKFTKSKFAVTVANCTAGLHLACIAADFKRGDEILVTAMTHVATAHAISLTGAKPVFCDINLYRGTINLADIKKKINKKTKGIIVVHMAGFSNQMRELQQICKKNNLKMIEDCAHALGTYEKKKHVGNFGLCGVFSFYPTKQISIGEGGMVITNNKKIYETIKRAKAFGIDKDIKERKIPGFYDVKSLGLNYRMTDYQSALGLSQIKRYENELLARKKNAKYYCEKLAEIKWIKFPQFDEKASYFIFQIFIPKLMRLKVIKCFMKEKIGFSIHYAKSLDNMSFYKSNNANCKNSIIYANENISLPVHSGINKVKINKILKVLKKI
jgi:perosamine synthetase